MHLCVRQYSGYAAVPPGLRQMCGGFVCAPCLANCGGGGLSRFSVLRGGWCFACGVGEGCRLLSLLLGGWSGARRGVGGVRSDIRVPEAKRGRVPL